ncbi:hypothetical protein CK503_14810 [Aliifodinibius salipaludis]|uniref:Uncharacterized protein n=1 Tax=Fodinibius salipaludis TaxID=2032627 RepID=A0A2A2G6J6_9BACT|nr:hypothetical protein [Aliifodinibius salipaludis]PAU92760.1 hypothetical protein CK503_14810 [Aliifodinibius salipaludis]
MKEEQDYIQDLSEIRSMMERSSKFLSLSGLAGVMAGTYALTGAYIAYSILDFNPDKISYSSLDSSSLPMIILLAIAVLIIAIGTAIFLSWKKADKRDENIWNVPSRQMLTNMAVPLTTGGIFVLILLSQDLIGLIAPSTLLFYGLALFTASKFTYDDLKYLGLIQIGLGLMGAWLVEYGLLLWALGFGVSHIVYGIYMHLKYER